MQTNLKRNRSLNNTQNGVRNLKYTL